NASSAAATNRSAAATPPRTGMSRFLGPIAGIAAGLGIAALLSSMGLGGAAAEFIGSLLLIGLVVFAVLFIVRRLRGGARQPAYQGAGNAGNLQRQAHTDDATQAASLSRRSGLHPAVANTVAPATEVVQ